MCTLSTQYPSHVACLVGALADAVVGMVGLEESKPACVARECVGGACAVGQSGGVCEQFSQVPHKELAQAPTCPLRGTNTFRLKWIPYLIALATQPPPSPPLLHLTTVPHSQSQYNSKNGAIRRITVTHTTSALSMSALSMSALSMSVMQQVPCQ